VNVGQTPSRVLPAVTVSATTAMTQTAAESTGGAARAIAPRMDATAVQTKSTHDAAVNTAQSLSPLPNAITVSVPAMTQTVALTTASAARAQSPGRPLPAATSAPTPATTQATMQPTGGATRVPPAAHAQRQGNATRSPGRRPAAVIASATATQTTTPARRVGGRTAGERVKARATTSTVASTPAPPMETTAAQTKPLDDVAANQPSSAAPADHDDYSFPYTFFHTSTHSAPVAARGPQASTLPASAKALLIGQPIVILGAGSGRPVAAAATSTSWDAGEPTDSAAAGATRPAGIVRTTRGHDVASESNPLGEESALVPSQATMEPEELRQHRMLREFESVCLASWVGNHLQTEASQRLASRSQHMSAVASTSALAPEIAVGVVESAVRDFVST
jgi:hypothetical protein